MKYIRTKDGRIVDANTYINHIGAYNEQARDYGLMIAESDNLEELFDEFVDIDNHDYYKIFHKNGITFALSKTGRFLGKYDIRLKEIGQIMGAIWTDKGLIYKAKMNKEGKFELI